MHVRLREKQSVISRAEVKAKTQPSYPKWAPQMQFRKPQISIPNSTNHFVISAQESRSQGEELVALPSRIRHRPKQEPTNLGLNTDPHPSTSSSSLFSSSSSFGLPYFPPQFTVLLSHVYCSNIIIISSSIQQEFCAHM